MNWNQLHHWFWHFPCQFCIITIFTRMPRRRHFHRWWHWIKYHVVTHCASFTPNKSLRTEFLDLFLVTRKFWQGGYNLDTMKEDTGGGRLSTGGYWGVVNTGVRWHLRCRARLHKLWYPNIRDTSTWSTFGAHGEHGDVFLFSNLVRCALILREPCSFADV